MGYVNRRNKTRRTELQKKSIETTLRQADSGIRRRIFGEIWGNLGKNVNHI